MVEKLERDVKQSGEKKFNRVEVFSVVHYPKDGGTKIFSISKDGDSFYVRVGRYDNSKNVSEQQVLKLDYAEVSQLAISLLRELLR